MQPMWHAHRLVFRLTGRGTEPARSDRLGTLAIRTVGRNSGEQRETLVWYMDDPPNRVLVASNAGSDRHPAWWLNLEVQPEAQVSVDGEWGRVTARLATPEEAARLWPRLEQLNPAYRSYRLASRREIPVVILEPHSSESMVPGDARSGAAPRKSPGAPT